MILFLQGFGRRDLFTGVPGERLMGWRRHVGLLVRLAEARAVSWEDRYAPDLDAVDAAGATLIVLRDWRYPRAAVRRLRERHRDTPVVAMLFQVPAFHLETQERGEELALVGASTVLVGERRRDAEEALFEADLVIARSTATAELYGELYAELGAELGHPRDRIRVLPHAPAWTLVEGRPVASTTPEQPPGDSVLAIGDNPIRKGLLRVHRAWRALGRPRPLVLASRRAARHRVDPGRTPPHLVPALNALVADPGVVIADPYADWPALVALHRRAAVLVCPSSIDHGPNTIVEALQTGTPVVASDLCGTSELLEGDDVIAGPAWWRPEAQQLSGTFEDRLAAMVEDRLVAPARSPPWQAAEHLAGAVNAWDRLLDELLS